MNKEYGIVLDKKSLILARSYQTGLLGKFYKDKGKSIYNLLTSFFDNEYITKIFIGMKENDYYTGILIQGDNDFIFRA
jgi:hypothetical protein